MQSEISVAKEDMSWLEVGSYGEVSGRGMTCANTAMSKGDVLYSCMNSVLPLPICQRINLAAWLSLALIALPRAAGTVNCRGSSAEDKGELQPIGTTAGLLG